MTTSDNPTQTTGRVRTEGTVTSYRYPLNENLTAGCRLRFIEYDRFNPYKDGQFGPTNFGKETTTATISLPLPVNVPENYQINTSSHNLGVWGNASEENIQKLLNAGSSEEQVNNTMESITKQGIAAAVRSIRSGSFNPVMALSGLGAATNNEDLMRTIQTYTGMIVNPHIATVFDGVSLRQIMLEWRFSPRSEAESIALKRIFDTIKLRIHPEEGAYGYSLNYPDLMYVEFTGKAEEYFPKFQKAMVHSVVITPESNGAIPMFKSGAPVGYTLQITATEMSVLTRNTLREHMGITQ